MKVPRYFWASAVVGGLVLGVLSIVLVVASGSTFGQRCAVQHERNTVAWEQCVSNMATGRK